MLDRHHDELEKLRRVHASRSAELTQQLALLQVRLLQSLCDVGSGTQHNAMTLQFYCTSTAMYMQRRMVCMLQALAVIWHPLICVPDVLAVC